MRKRERFYISFAFFLICCLLLFLFGKIPFLGPVNGFFSRMVSPLSRGTYLLFHQSSSDTEIGKLKAENAILLKKIVDQKQLEAQNKALQDQFQTAYPKSDRLLPAKIIGSPGFFPGVSEPDNLIINRGKEDHVVVGSAVVVKNNLIGRITRISESLSRVDIVTKSGNSFTAKTVGTNALGVIKGDGDSLTFSNVVLSDKLEKDDIVVTRGDISEEGNGLPPDLVIGKIISIDKKASSLFQSAKIARLVSLTSLSEVFIVVVKH